MKNIGIILLSICAFLFVGCENELDNYDAPDGGISGIIQDAQTGEAIPLPVQGSGGVIISMMEQGTNAAQSVDFYAKMDGSFENSRVFSCEYKVVAKGPFVNPCEGTVNVKKGGVTQFNLSATPYARIDASANVSGRIVTINYTVTPTDPSFSVSEVYGFWNFAPGVDNNGSNQAGKTTVKETSGTITIDMDNEKEFAANLHKINANGNKIYVRVGAKTQNNINYSKIVEVVVK